MGIEKQPLKFYMNRLLFVENSRESKIEDINLKPDNLKGLPEKMSRTHRKIIKDMEALSKLGPEGDVPRLVPAKLHETLPNLSEDTTPEVQEKQLIKRTEQLVIEERPASPELPALEPPEPEPSAPEPPAPVKKKKKAPAAKPFRKKLPKNNRRMGR